MRRDLVLSRPAYDYALAMLVESWEYGAGRVTWFTNALFNDSVANLDTHLSAWHASLHGSSPA